MAIARPLMIDIQGLVLTEEDRELIQHPLVGGLILFSRNYASPEQMRELVQQIRDAASRPILIAVDQEGGRVQRFRDGFTALPPLALFGKCYAIDPEQAQTAAYQAGWLMAGEILATGIDISFAPVVDLNRGDCKVLAGGRSFNADPQITTKLAASYIAGMQAAGMQATIKHFPGHGGVTGDTHVDMPVDPRPYEVLAQEDLVPFRELISQGITAVMPSHVIYAAVDDMPAGFSNVWLQTILRQQLKFNGMIFTDDLSMMGAKAIPDVVARVQTALAAGCDMALVCNDRKAAINVVDNLGEQVIPQQSQRLQAMFAHEHITYQDLQSSRQWNDAVTVLNKLRDTIVTETIK